MQAYDEQSTKCRFKIAELSTEISILDQHVQRLYHACTLYLILFNFLKFYFLYKSQYSNLIKIILYTF